VKAVLYAAKSTADEHDSIGSQIAAMRTAIEAQGDREIVGTYRDVAASAYTGSRGQGLAAAIEAAERAAVDDEGVELWCFDADRLARGDGRTARHLGGLWFDLLAAGVRVRAVQGDHDLNDPIRAVLRGERAFQDSSAKSGHVRRGLKATVEAGKWRGGTLPDGYRLVPTVDDRGRVTRTYEKDPDRAPVIELVWSLALAGRSLQAIQLELSRRGYETNPNRGGAKAKGFDPSRIARLLEVPAYCGLQRRGDDLVPLTDWPTFVTVEDFHRQRRERQERHPVDCTPKPGRQAPYVLAGLATCACGSRLRVETQRRPRKDGTRRRTYLCTAHRDRHQDAPDWCPSAPFDADVVDRMVIDGLSDLLSDIGSVGDTIAEARRRDRQVRERKVARAQAAAKKATTAADRAAATVADALADDDPERAAILTDAARIKRQEAAEAKRAMDAELDALSLDDEAPEDTDVLSRLRDVLRDPLQRAGNGADDVRALNARLAENFSEFLLHRGVGGKLSVVPILSSTGVRSLMRSVVGDDRCDAISTADVDGSMAVQGLTDAEAQNVLDALQRASSRLSETPRALLHRRVRGPERRPPSARRRGRGSR
jgi:DNA invertase Pin-like site-specific DNA recombinase